MTIRLLALAVVVGLFVAWGAGPAAADEAASEFGVRPTIAAPEGGMWTRTCPPHCARTRLSLRLEAGVGCTGKPDSTLGTERPAGVTGFDWGEIDCGPAFAGRIGLRFRGDACTMVELRFSMIPENSSDSRQTGQFAFQNQNGISPVATTTLENETMLWTGDATVWRRLAGSPCLELRGGLGVRVLRFDDQAVARDWNGLAPTSNLAFDVENVLVAGQVAGAVEWTKGRFSAEVSARGFVGSMNRTIESYEDSILSGGVKRGKDESTELGWGCELGLDLRFRLCSAISLTAGYSFLFVGETVRGSDAMDFSQAAIGAVQIRQSTDTLLAQAIFAGVQIDL